jgi:hypothetical protein
LTPLLECHKDIKYGIASKFDNDEVEWHSFKPVYDKPSDVRPIAQAIIVQSTIYLSQSKRLYSQFSGMMPISITNSELSTLKKFRYVVSPKLDGERNFLVVYGSDVYLMNRNCFVRHWFHHPELIAYHDTLLDVEVMWTSGVIVWLDTLCVCGESVRGLPLFERLLSCSSIQSIIPRLLKQQVSFFFEFSNFSNNHSFSMCH